MAQAPIWRYLDALSSTKDTSVLDEMDFAKEYKPFIINHALSYHQDAVLAANMMNERPTLEPALQFLFLLNTLRPRKRFSRWLKNTSVTDDVRNVAEYYGCSYRHARDLVSLHSSDQLATIRARLEKGGPVGKRGLRHEQQNE